ncbi:MAG: ribose-phosphate diphosphokinase [Methanobacteriota archaeon]
MLVVGGSENPRLSAELVKSLAARLSEGTTKRFPDGESYVRLGTRVSGEDVVVVQSTRTDAALVELLLWLDAARRHGARRTLAVVPYLGYARQDRTFLEGEAVSAEAVARILDASCDGLVTVDPHQEHVLRFYRKPAQAVSAAGPIADRLRRESPGLVLAPDAGAAGRAAATAKLLGCPHDHLEKRRLSGTEVVMTPKSLDVRGKTVVLVDDIVSTGGTMVTAARTLREQGAARLLAACTHGLFVGDALERMKAAGYADVVATDTVESAASRVTVAPLVADAVRALLGR